MAEPIHGRRSSRSSSAPRKAPGRTTRASGSRCPALADPVRNAVDASWTFAGRRGAVVWPAARAAGRVAPARADAQAAREPLRGGRTRGGRRPTPPQVRAAGRVTTRPGCTTRLEEQIHLIYERLTGASDIQEDELRRRSRRSRVVTVAARVRFAVRPSGHRRLPWPIWRDAKSERQQTEPLLAESTHWGAGTRARAGRSSELIGPFSRARRGIDSRGGAAAAGARGRRGRTCIRPHAVGHVGADFRISTARRS